jgi:hypothetical protein
MMGSAPALNKERQQTQIFPFFLGQGQGLIDSFHVATIHASAPLWN